MNDPENFISRWSRRKREAVNEEPTKAGAEDARGLESDKKDAKAVPPESGTPVPEFDIASLPPVESIEAGTDITGFMQPGVPAAMRHAALRRAWSADPAIRDFMGPTENYWDAAGPAGVPGFGDLDPNLDVKRLVSELFGETRREEPAQAKPQQQISSAKPDNQSTDIPSDAAAPAPPAAGPDLSQCTENDATQKESLEGGPAKKIARRHGGAMPQ
jgi:hypothetical protein